MSYNENSGSDTRKVLIKPEGSLGKRAFKTVEYYKSHSMEWRWPWNQKITNNSRNQAVANDIYYVQVGSKFEINVYTYLLLENYIFY